MQFSSVYNAQTISWNQPVLSNKYKVSCSRKQQLCLVRFQSSLTDIDPLQQAVLLLKWSYWQTLTHYKKQCYYSSGLTDIHWPITTSSVITQVVLLTYIDPLQKAVLLIKWSYWQTLTHYNKQCYYSSGLTDRHWPITTSSVITQVVLLTVTINIAITCMVLNSWSTSSYIWSGLNSTMFLYLHQNHFSKHQSYLLAHVPHSDLHT